MNLKYTFILVLSLGFSHSFYSGEFTWGGSQSTFFDVSTNWVGGAVPSASDNITIPSGTPNYPEVRTSVSITDVTVNSGATLTILGSGTLTVTGTYNSIGSTIFNGAGTLDLSGPVTSLGTFTESTGTVKYSDGSAQNIDADDYYNLIISGGATKTLQGTTNVTNNLTVTVSPTILDVNTRTLDVNDLSTISSGGKVTISTGTYDADGEMNCTASLEFTDDGALNLSNTVTSLGSFTKGTSTVTYDGAGDQTVDNVDYHHLVISGGATKDSF